MLCRDVVNGALRKLGVLARGREPRLAEQMDTLQALRGLYGGLITAGTLGRLNDVSPLGTAYTAREGDHVYRDDAATITVTLPDRIPLDAEPGPYGSQWQPPANRTDLTRAPKDGAVVRLTDTYVGVTATWIYDAAAGGWATIEELGLADEAPLSRRDPNGLQAYLASRVADDFGMDVQGGTALASREYLAGLAQGFSQPSHSIEMEWF